jgi:hypothetical protein
MFNSHSDRSYGNALLFTDPNHRFISVSNNRNYYYRWGMISIVVPFLANLYLVRNNDLSWNGGWLLFIFFPTILFSILAASYLVKARVKSKITFSKKDVVLNSGEVISLKLIECLISDSNSISTGSGEQVSSYQLILRFKNQKEIILVNAEDGNDVVFLGDEIATFIGVKFN